MYQSVGHWEVGDGTNGSTVGQITKTGGANRQAEDPSYFQETERMTQAKRKNSRNMSFPPVSSKYILSYGEHRSFLSAGISIDSGKKGTAKPTSR